MTDYGWNADKKSDRQSDCIRSDGMSKRVLAAGLAALVASAGISPPVVASSDSVVPSSTEWKDRATAYALQQQELQRDLGDDYYVASYKGLVHQGQLVTFSIWTDSVPTALPKTDFVWLQDSKMSYWFVVSWSDLEAAIGEFPRLESADPPRYLTPATIPASYFNTLEENFVPPLGFPRRVASGRH